MEEARRLVVGLELGRRRREAHDRQGQRRDEDGLVEALHRRRERAPEELVDRGPALEALVGLGELRRRRQDHGHAAPEVQGLPLLVVRERDAPPARRAGRGGSRRPRRRRRRWPLYHGQRVDDVLAADVDARVLGRRPHRLRTTGGREASMTKAKLTMIGVPQKMPKDRSAGSVE